MLNLLHNVCHSNKYIQMISVIIKVHFDFNAEGYNPRSSVVGSRDIASRSRLDRFAPLTSTSWYNPTHLLRRVKGTLSIS